MSATRLWASLAALLLVILAACNGAGGAATPVSQATGSLSIASAIPPAAETATVAPTLTSAAQTTQPPAATLAASAQQTAIPDGLKLEALKAANYRTGFTTNGTATLKDGVYTEVVPAGGASAVNKVALVEPVAYGQLPDGRTVAAVILASETGGSGTFYELEVMGLLENGTPLNLAYTFLGDRVKINQVAFQPDGSITVDMITQGPNDPMAAPSLPQTLEFRYMDGQLVKKTTPAMAAPAPPVPPLTVTATLPITATIPITTPTSLTSVVWQWNEFENKTVGHIKVKDAYLYLLEFSPNGQVKFNADCNSGYGSYQAGQDGSLHFASLIVTLAGCQPESLSHLYVESLNNVSSYVLNQGQLYLTIKDNGGIMKFGPQP